MCRCAYPKHPKGCPNLGKKKTCSPGQSLIDEIINFKKPIYMIYTEFRLGEFAEQIKQKTQTLTTIPQFYNLRYWQPVARKEQRNEETGAMEKYGLEIITNSPEAHGVNLSKIMKTLGVDLKWGWPPKNMILAR